ncbi:MAG: hypothetical protein JOZ59_05515 [Candidatus Eremiobacteraeota bacterium]|nr:hypothetical protein [Candidatus Eremiobacteraeota bacterium]
MMTMSTQWLWRLRLTTACVAAFAATGLAAARAISLADVAPAQLIPSATPALLGPITESGRKGWDCKPERAAAAPTTREADLPSENSTR